MADINGIEFAHTVNFFSKGIDSQGPYYRVEYLLNDWSDSDAFINALMGVSTYGGGSANRTGPHRHPLSPNLICTSADARGIAPVKNEDGYPLFSKGGMVQAEYRAPTSVGAIDPRDDPGFWNQIDPQNPILWCVQELSSQVEIFTLTDHEYKIDMGGGVQRATSSPVQVELNLVVMNLTFPELPYLPMKKIRQLRGSVNSNTPFLGVEDAECVKFENWSTTRRTMKNGQQGCSLTLQFIEREVSWNKVLRPNKLPTESDAWGDIISPLGGKRFPAKNLQPMLIL